MELTKEMIVLKQEITTKEEAIKKAGNLLVENGCVDEAYVDAMFERNEMLSTYMGNFIAIPHGTDEAKKYVKKSGISVVQIPNGVRFGDDEDEKMTMMVFGISGIGNEHLEILQKIAIFCADVENVVKLVSANTEEEIISLLQEVE
ncbi:PTS sugar transporter subunit IIA [Vagococcus xieshaowenii]|uniref:Mannitol-specific phosphotransferase enzyme IIA component n=1 Tax=Vagococcus xieshaowenii TaxID=2562451 RepID=A0AAJ5EGP3_9ENTE|nr:PTS sugar transporter subunit IIA [Vagococcus xieshaowenii]QCA28351.1 PTS mannitol transporter subunit IIA [Vagococcus xieshaowenii]TFZ42261.1 PTS mannitol transporter subunit IIA [Vagococcus xieshaowenii]